MKWSNSPGNQILQLSLLQTYLNADVLKVGIPHHIWSTVRNNVHDSIRAQVKCRLLTGTYILEGNRAAFNQFVADSTCKLCSSLLETRQHFLAECAVFKESRQEYIQKLTDSGILPDHLTIQLQDPVFLTQLTLDCSRCEPGTLISWGCSSFIHGSTFTQYT